MHVKYLSSKNRILAQQTLFANLVGLQYTLLQQCMEHFILVVWCLRKGICFLFYPTVSRHLWYKCDEMFIILVRYPQSNLTQRITGYSSLLNIKPVPQSDTSLVFIIKKQKSHNVSHLRSQVKKGAVRFSIILKTRRCNLRWFTRLAAGDATAAECQLHKRSPHRDIEDTPCSSTVVIPPVRMVKYPTATLMTEINK